MISELPPKAFEKIDAALLGVAEALPRLPEWHEAVRQLEPATPELARLAVYQAVRDEGSLTKEEGKFLVLFTVDHILARTSGFERIPMEDRLARLGEIRNAARENRLSGEDAAADDDLPESDELALWRGAMRERLKAHGERMLATWMRTVPGMLASDLRRGRRLFFGRPSRRTARLRRLAQELFDEVCGCIRADEPMGPLRRRWWPDGEGFSTEIYPTPVELYGGPRDGELVDPEVHIDVLSLQELFEDISIFYLVLEGDRREDLHFWIEATYEGRHVGIILATGACQGDKPTVKSDQTKKWDWKEEDEE